MRPKRRSAVCYDDRMTTTQTETNAVELTEYRLNRNYLRIGDPVKVTPRVGTSFRSDVRRITDRGAGLVEVEVVHPRNGAIRTVTVDRIHRKAVSRKALAPPPAGA
jgi:hypothetical protein